MTRTEARNLLIARMPDRTIFLTIQDQHYVHNSFNHGPSTQDAVEYRVSVLPGFDMSDCQQVTGKTLDQVVSLALNLSHKPAEATADEMDAHFDGEREAAIQNEPAMIAAVCSDPEDDGKRMPDSADIVRESMSRG
jgi:hypothetical protein